MSRWLLNTSRGSATSLGNLRQFGNPRSKKAFTDVVREPPVSSSCSMPHPVTVSHCTEPGSVFFELQEQAKLYMLSPSQQSIQRLPGGSCLTRQPQGLRAGTPRCLRFAFTSELAAGKCYTTLIDFLINRSRQTEKNRGYSVFRRLTQTK